MHRQRSRRPSYLLAGLLWAGCGSKGTATEPVARQDCRGGKVWHADDAVRLQGCIKVDGSLHLGGALEAVDELLNLEHISGNLSVGPSYRLGSLAALGALRHVGGDVLIESNPLLSGVYLGRLTTVSGDLRIRHNKALTAVSMHTLRRVGGILAIENNARLQRLDLGTFKEAVGGNEISGKSLDDTSAF